MYFKKETTTDDVKKNIAKNKFNVFQEEEIINLIFGSDAFKELLNKIDALEAKIFKLENPNGKIEHIKYLYPHYKFEYQYKYFSEDGKIDVVKLPYQSDEYKDANIFVEEQNTFKEEKDIKYVLANGSWVNTCQ